MICTQCKKQILDESKMKLLNVDGDFVCNVNCQKRYEEDREEFFNNIHDDWYNNYMCT